MLVSRRWLERSRHKRRHLVARDYALKMAAIRIALHDSVVMGVLDAPAGVEACGRRPRTAPQTPGEAQKRPRLRALQNVERQFHLTTLVEGAAPTNKHSPSVDEGEGFSDESSFLTRWEANSRSGRQYPPPVAELAVIPPGLRRRVSRHYGVESPKMNPSSGRPRRHSRA